MMIPGDEWKIERRDPKYLPDGITATAVGRVAQKPVIGREAATAWPKVVSVLSVAHNDDQVTMLGVVLIGEHAETALKWEVGGVVRVQGPVKACNGVAQMFVTAILSAEKGGEGDLMISFFGRP